MSDPSLELHGVELMTSFEAIEADITSPEYADAERLDPAPDSAFGSCPGSPMPTPRPGCAGTRSGP